VTVKNDGHFLIQDKDARGNSVKGDIWLNLKDQTLNFKRKPENKGDKTYDYYGTYESPGTIKVVK